MKHLFIYIFAIFQIIVFFPSGICAKENIIHVNKSNLSPHILLQQNSIRSTFQKHENIISQLENLKITYTEFLSPGHYTDWIDIDKVEFPLKVTLSSTQELLMTFDSFGFHSFSDGVKTKVYSNNHTHSKLIRTDIAKRKALEIAYRFTTDSKKYAYATIKVEMDGHFLRLENKGSMNLEINLNPNSNLPFKFAMPRQMQPDLTMPLVAKQPLVKNYIDSVGQSI